ncbi:MAG: hypothetical protein IKK04_04670, partial [Bacteroidales bacterium]|nr:hypothetical protein [Bacteroidales bacterium]
SSARNRIIALWIENPYNILRQIANLPQQSSARNRIIALWIENPYNILRQIANLPQQSSARNRIIALRIENPYNNLRQIANLPQLKYVAIITASFSLPIRVFRVFRCSIKSQLRVGCKKRAISAISV